MPRLEVLPKGSVLAAFMVSVILLAQAPRAVDVMAGEEPGAAFRHQAPIVVEQPGAFVQLALPVNAYANSRQPGLADLRVVDARGERVPFALLPPRAAQSHAAEAARPADLYPLPARRVGDKELASPLEVQVVGERITVRRLPAAAGRAAAATSSAGPAPGWLFDLGVPVRDEPPATALRLTWSGPVEFSAGFELDVSDDLRQWRRAGGGQLLALSAAAGSLTQRLVILPGAGAARFVRLRWVDAAAAPALSGAVQMRTSRRSQVLDQPTTFVVSPSAEPPPVTSLPAGRQPIAAAAVAEGALHYDLGAVLPLVEINLPLAGAHRVAPARVQGRLRSDEPWRDLAQTVFYRLERGDAVDRPPPLALQANVRFLRLVPDARSGPLPATPLSVQAQLLSLVFATQGQPPYRLLAGSSDAKPGALPLATLVPAIDEERARFGRATLGAWSENEALAREEAQRALWASWRPALLWALLLAGVGALGWMVWRLARSPRAG